MKEDQSISVIAAMKKFGEVFEELDDIILIIDKQGTFVYVNRALRKHLGFQKKRFTGKNIVDCFLFDEKLPNEDIVKMIYNKRDFVTHIKNSQDEIRHLAWKTKIFTQNNQKYVLSIIRDVTPQIKLQKTAEQYSMNLQEMVYQRTQQLEKEKQKALELHQAKAIFLSKMSHEFRTPLTAIKGCVEMIKDEELSTTEKDKCLSVIDRNANSLLSMINDTLNMIQIEQNKYQIHEKEFELKPILKAVVDTCQVLASRKGLDIKLELKEDVPRFMFSDPVAIEHILTNLIGNAIKYTEKGKIVLRVKQRYFPKTYKKKLYFYIEDTGVGIPLEYHRRIFRSFEQYLDNQIVHARGSGLGLAISKQLSKLLGGNLKLLSSKLDVGSTFVFSLPIREMPIM